MPVRDRDTRWTTFRITHRLRQYWRVVRHCISARWSLLAQFAPFRLPEDYGHRRGLPVDSLQHSMTWVMVVDGQVTCHPGPQRQFMSGQFHTARFPPRCVPPECVESIVRSSGGGAAPKRWRRPVPRQYRVPASRRNKSNFRPTHSSPAQRRGRLPGPVSCQGVEQGSTLVGGSTILSHRASQSGSSMVGRPRTGAAARSFP